MVNDIRTILGLALFLLLFASCKTGSVSEYKKLQAEGEVPRITLGDAKKDFDAGTAVIVDSRAEPAYKQEHIAGSVNIPIGSPDSEFSKIPQGKKIIVYCS